MFSKFVLSVLQISACVRTKQDYKENIFCFEDGLMRAFIVDLLELGSLGVFVGFIAVFALVLAPMSGS